MTDTPSDEAAIARTVRLGLILFAVYVTLYASFVLLSTFAPALMRAELIEGINFGVGYGMALILAAGLIALLYVWLCRGKAQ